MKNKNLHKTILIILVCTFVFVIGLKPMLYIADKVIFNITMGHLSPDEQERIRKNQEDYSTIGRIAYNLIAGQLDREEQEREKRIEAGLPVAGRDTALIWQDKYEISKYSDIIVLDFYADKEKYSLLYEITNFDVVKRKVYVLSNQGYAVIDKNNKCKIFIVDLQESEDENCNKRFKNCRIEDEHIRYLSSFDEFSNEEKTTFEKMRNE